MRRTFERLLQLFVFNLRRHFEARRIPRERIKPGRQIRRQQPISTAAKLQHPVRLRNSWHHAEQSVARFAQRLQTLGKSRKFGVVCLPLPIDGNLQLQIAKIRVNDSA